jgi:DNA repair protein RecO (recombination protein O)
MTESASGIILRTRPLTETSLIIHWLTPEIGRIATVAKGARRAKSPFAGKLDLFYAAEFSFSRSRRSDLHNLREVKLHETHGAIRADLEKLQQAAYAVNFLEVATESETPLPEIFTLMRDFLKALDGAVPAPQNIFAFELHLLHALGLAPDLAQARLTPGSKKIIAALLPADSKIPAGLQLSRAQTVELREWLGRCLIAHLGRLPRGRASVVGGAAEK